MPIFDDVERRTMILHVCVTRRGGEIGTWLWVSLRDGIPRTWNCRVRDATSYWRHWWRQSSAPDAARHQVSNIATIFLTLFFLYFINSW